MRRNVHKQLLKGSPRIKEGEQAESNNKGSAAGICSRNGEDHKLKSDKQRAGGERSESDLSPPMMLMT